MINRILGGLAVLFNLLDNLTTYLCLRDPVEGLYEANPIARWIFDQIGLVEGLAAETVVTTLAILFIVVTNRTSYKVRMVCLALIALLAAYAATNNLFVMQDIGLL